MAFGDYTKYEVAAVTTDETGHYNLRQVVVDTLGRIYVVHRDDGVACSYSDDGGTTWTQVILDSTAYTPSVCLDEDGHTLHIVYCDLSISGGQVKYITGDVAAGWSIPVAVGAAGSAHPSIHVAGNNIVYITYYQGSNWTVRNIAGGLWSVAAAFGTYHGYTSWSTITSINDGGYYTPYIFWNYGENVGAQKVYYTYWHPILGVWVAPIELHSALWTIYGMSAAVDSHDTIHFAHHDLAGGTNYIRYRYKLLGEAWSGVGTVNSSSSSRWPSVSVDGGDCVCIAWDTSYYNYIRQTLDNGNTWSSVLRLSTTGNSGYPSLMENTPTGKTYMSVNVMYAQDNTGPQMYWDIDTLSPISAVGNYAYFM